VEDVLAWFEETLALRHAALHAKMAEPDYAAFQARLAAYQERVDPAAYDSGLDNRDEDDDDLDWWEDELEELAPAVVLAAIHKGGDKYTFVVSADADDGGYIPAWEYHVLGRTIIGQSSRFSDNATPYAGRDHGKAKAVEVRYLNEDKLRDDAQDFPGSIEVG